MGGDQFYRAAAVSVARFGELLEPLDRRADVCEVSLDRCLHGRLSRVVGKRPQQVEPALRLTHAETSGSLNHRPSVLHVRLIMRGQSSMLLG